MLTSGSTFPTTAASRSCATPSALRAAMAITADYLPTERISQPVRLHAGTLAPRARRRSLGRAALARPAGRRGADRAQLPPGATLRRRTARRPASEVLNEVVLNQVLVAFGDAETTNRVIARNSGRRHLLVRRHRLAGTHRDAHQRFILGHHGRRCRTQPRRDDSHRPPGVAGALARQQNFRFTTAANRKVDTSKPRGVSSVFASTADLSPGQPLT